MWDIVNARYVYPDFNGLDWNAVRMSTLNRINAGIEDADFYLLMRDAIKQLRDEHSHFLSPEEAHQEMQEYEGDAQYVGIGVISDINYDKFYAYVLTVIPDSPAERAGILPHDHILKINGEPAVLVDGTINMPLLRGPAGTLVTVTVNSPGARPRTVVMERAKLSPEIPVSYHLIVSGTHQVGYLMIPTLFENSVGDDVRTALNQLISKGRLDGLIIDMRVNSGGAYPELMRCLGFFTSGSVGSLTDRSGAVQTLSARPEKVGNSQTVPIMVLTGSSTESFAEVFAGILNAKGRARIVGQKTAGNIETLHGHDFEDGSRAWIAEETFRLPAGGNWESQGLTPDILIDKAWDEFTEQNDPVIAAALEALLK